MVLSNTMCGETGVSRRQATFGETMGPLAENE